jgi:hypothetical protein
LLGFQLMFLAHPFPWVGTHCPQQSPPVGGLRFPELVNRGIKALVLHLARPPLSLNMRAATSMILPIIT